VHVTSVSPAHPPPPRFWDLPPPSSMALSRG
jgi:hypothetical protein